jgi:hypothetical protein
VVVGAAQHALANHLAVMAVHVLSHSAKFRHDLPPTGLTSWRLSLRHPLEHAWTQPIRCAGVPIGPRWLKNETVADGLPHAAFETTSP